VAELSEVPPEIRPTDLAGGIRDFADTAEWAGTMDLILTVDTAMAHLAGAMNIPVWTLLSSSPDWRWLLARSDSPWYPSMKLFRQSRPDHWDDVVERVRLELGYFAPS
jgi:ADP-heptose:LPS heptosyltransferase